MILAEPLRVAREFVHALDGLGVPWYLGGSVASSMYGMPRLTQDVDVVAALSLAHAEPLCAALSATFYVDLDAARDAIRRRGTFNAIHQDLLYKVDVYVQRGDAFSRTEMDERQRIDLADGGHLWVARAEHIVLHKLTWFRAGGEVSDRQWGDILNVLFVRGDRLDVGVLSRWAPDLGVSDLLGRALAEASARGTGR